MIQFKTEEFNTEEYDRIYENPFKSVRENPLSTFSIDVDTASYSNVRRFLGMNRLPPPDAVRIEELINYFTYEYPLPREEHPFSIYTEIGECPWNEENRLVHIGLQGKPLEKQDTLADHSGSSMLPKDVSGVKKNSLLPPMSLLVILNSLVRIQVKMMNMILLLHLGIPVIF